MLRFVVPLFPEAAHQFAPYAMAFGAVGVVYGAILAFGQTDLKRLVAYSSVSHLGFVLMGFSRGTTWRSGRADGHALRTDFSTGALFVLVGSLQERMQTRQIDRLGGLWTTIPRLAASRCSSHLASLGLPGLAILLANFWCCWDVSCALDRCHRRRDRDSRFDVLCTSTRARRFPRPQCSRLAFAGRLPARTPCVRSHDWASRLARHLSATHFQHVSPRNDLHGKQCGGRDADTRS